MAPLRHVQYGENQVITTKIVREKIAKELQLTEGTVKKRYNKAGESENPVPGITAQNAWRIRFEPILVWLCALGRKYII